VRGDTVTIGTEVSGGGTVPAASRLGAAPFAPVLAALLVVYFVWGSTYLAIRIALDGIPPLLMGAGRFLLAGGLLYAGLRARGVAAPTARQWRNATAVGAFLFLGGNGLVTVAEQWVSSGLVALGVAAVPLWAVLFASVRDGRPRTLEALGLAVGLGGVVLLNSGTELGGKPLGALACLASSLSWAFGSMWSRGRDLPPGMMAAAAEMLGGGVLMTVVGVAWGERMTALPAARPLAAFVYLVVFGSLVAFSAFHWLLHRVRPALATSNAFVNPMVAVALGAVVAGEHVGREEVLAMAAILAGVALVMAGSRR
jgi:drug/metabolite transporter (DMT)-like permease